MPTIRLTYILIASLALLLLASCNDDNFDDTTYDVTTSPADTVSTIAVTGKVLDREGNPLSKAEVSLLHNGLVHTTTSTADGSYAFQDLPAVDQRVEALAHNQDFVESSAILSITEEDIEHDFILIREDEVDGGSASVATMLSDSLVLISGKVATDDGTFLEGAIVLIARQDLADIQFAASDENGDWAIATSQRGEFVLFVVDQCRQIVQDAQIITITDDDFDAGTVSAGNNVYTEYTFSGRVLDCETGQEVEGVSISITFEGDNNFYQDDSGDGSYNLEGNNCGNATCYTIRAISPFGYRDTIVSCLPLDGNLNNDIYVCKEALVANESMGTFIVDGIQLDFNFVSATRESGGWLIAMVDPDLTEAAIILTASESGSGTCQGVAIFENIGTSKYLTRQGSAPTYTIDSVVNNYVYGSMTGTLGEVATGRDVTASATYKASIQ